MNTHPKHWLDFLKTNGLNGLEIEIPESKDLSELGASFKIMNEKESIDEMLNFYPSIIVKHQNYIPIGNCCVGSGDPYFINSDDGPNGKLYRVYHDEVIDETYDKDSAISVVLIKYEDILKFKV
ncbi:hypothetical protein [Roseivirga sp.]|uniref:hypothetical protein n=1 Tax=Roseivirga sp. TaxID=1964215 RepID=UPI002B2685A2|nr:hypothetical protein [Roseivirga sp.]